MIIPVSLSSDPDLQKVPQALMRSAEKARLLAEQSGTRFVVRQAPVSATNKEIMSNVRLDYRGVLKNNGKLTLMELGKFNSQWPGHVETVSYYSEKAKDKT